MIRSTRTRQARKPFTPSRPTVQSSVNYNINKTKALNQKLEATDRDHLKVELKNGNLVLTFSTAAFEAFRAVTRTIYTSLPFENVKFEFENRLSKDGITRVEESLVAFKGGIKLYRINLYLTTSVVNVNGGHLQTFYSDHLHFIISELDKIGDFSNMNKIMRDKICELLETDKIAQDFKSVTDSSNIVSNTDAASNITCDTISLPGRGRSIDMNLSINETEICLVCDKHCADNAVLCDRCNAWSHYACENISLSDRKGLESGNNYYTCTSCRDLLTIDNIDRSEIQECNPSVNSTEDNSCPSIVKVLNARELGGKKNSRSKSVSTPKSIGNLPRRININRKCVDVAINTDICFSDTKILDNLPDKEKQLKAKERELVNKESALKVKERTLNDTSKKLAAAQSYIYTLEKKIEELEQSLILSERAKSMQNVNSDCNSQSNTNNNSNSELKILEQRFNLLESKVGQFLNSDKSIVINNNNYGSNNRHELSQEGSDTPVYNVQATEKNCEEKKASKVQEKNPKTTTACCKQSSTSMANATNITESSICKVTSVSSQSKSEHIGQSLCESANTNNGKATVISSFNVENFTTNAVYLSELLGNVDILAIQEHWLWSFEKSKLETFAAERDFCTTIKCTDEYDPISNRQRMRGWGGCGILWRAHLDQFVKIHNDGNERICVITLDTKPKPICIVAVYMPCTGSKEYDRKYEQCFDEISELTIKFAHHTIIVLGDLNASLIRKQKTTRDKVFLASIQEINLCVPRNYPSSHTFFHHNDKASSQIDYILAFNDSNFFIETDIYCMSPLNLSSHVPVTANFICNLHATEKTDVVNTATMNRINWEKCDTLKYQRLLDEKFNSLDIASGTLDEQFQNVADIFKTSAEDASEEVKKRRVRKLKPWPMNLRSLCHDSKQAYNIFKQDGGNKCETNILWVNCKLAKKKLRQAQRQLDANNRYKLYYEIMDSYTSNQKLFYKLINIQRTGQVKKLTKLVIDGINLESSEEIRDGWASYFEKLSTLSTSSSFCDHQHQIVKRNIQNILTLQNSGNKGMQYATLDEVTAAINKMKNGKSPDELNLMSEHLKCGGQIVPIILKALFDRVLQERDVPEIFQKELDELNFFHKSQLKILQNLPERTADAAIYILSGQMPIEAFLHRQILLQCASTDTVRNQFIPKLRTLLYDFNHEIGNLVFSNNSMLLRVILDVSSPQVPILIQTFSFMEKIEAITRGMVYALHHKRCSILDLVGS
ncbi:unnamed protein product [Mytilus edulis]|uniref:PHD-type domain-containing protein n=1 Tax=Mytilus edulis TaxID=6550 RepID=A0A8S3TIL1_MYTED|nr:unnamed protein product [Mytilus edulis]